MAQTTQTLTDEREQRARRLGRDISFVPFDRSVFRSLDGVDPYNEQDLAAAPIGTAQRILARYDEERRTGASNPRLEYLYPQLGPQDQAACRRLIRLAGEQAVAVHEAAESVVHDPSLLAEVRRAAEWAQERERERWERARQAEEVQ